MKGSENIVEQTITIKMKIKPQNQADELSLSKSMEQYRLACNDISDYIFNHDFEMAQKILNNALYHHIRDIYHLKSQMTQSAIRNVVACYKTVKTQLSQKPYRYNTNNKDKNGKAIWKSAKRDLTWLWYPINFKRPQIDLQRNRDWSFLKNNQISLNTIDNRIKVTYVCHGFDQYLDGTWKFGLAKIIKFNGNWYMHISMTKELPDYQLGQTCHVVGIDRGLRFLVTTYNEKGKTEFFNGKSIIHKRHKFKKLRAQLQAKGTKSAKRRLKKIGSRENRWMSNVNHQISKTLVDQFGPNTLFVLEDLTNVRFTTEKVKKSQRYEQVSWAFYQLEQFLIYKAQLNNCDVIKVAAQYTSQRCPKCGRINKSNRKHDQHLYICNRCGYSSNDDRIGAMNIQQLGTQYISGNSHPIFKKINN